MANPEHSLFFISHVDEKTAVFSEEERHHALSVLRKDPSGFIQATDGKGTIYTCSLREGTAEAVVEALRIQPAPMPRIHAFIGIPDRDAFEEAVTNLAALGIVGITPMVCQYCQKKWWETWEKHRERCHKKMVAGIKQSLNAWLPELKAPTEFDKVLDTVRSFSPKRCIVADADGMPLGPALDGLAAPTDTACFIGPPGGFSQNEKDELKSSGFVFVKIAHTRLRTELAAVILCAQALQTGLTERI
jgi:16S rRNA (uracil1498-N3)-methyltransferase